MELHSLFVPGIVRANALIPDLAKESPLISNSQLIQAFGAAFQNRFPYGFVRKYRGYLLIIFPLQSVQKAANRRKLTMKNDILLMLDRFAALYEFEFSCFLDWPVEFSQIAAAVPHMIQIISSIAMPMNTVVSVGEITAAPEKEVFMDAQRMLALLMEGNKEQLHRELADIVERNFRDSFRKTRSFQLTVDYSQICCAALLNSGIAAHTVFRDPGAAPSEDTLLSSKNLLRFLFRQTDATIEAIARQRVSLSLFEQIKLYIQQNIESDISRDTIADNFFLHPDYLSRFFHEHAGVTLAAYIRSARIDYAKQLLQTTDLAANEISFHVGYESAAHFTRAFRRETGLTPSEFRKQFRATGEK